MTLYECLLNYNRENPAPPAGDDLPAQELGRSLSLFHLSLVEVGLPFTGPENDPRLSASPEDITPLHISHFIVAFLPFHAVSDTGEFNQVLFDLFSFFKWMDKNKVPHGLKGVAVDKMIRKLSDDQKRCLKLSHLLDDESGRILDETLDIASTLSDLFKVEQIGKNHLQLKPDRHPETLRLKLPGQILKLLRQGDRLDLVLGDTSEKWVILEAGKVFPNAKG